MQKRARGRPRVRPPEEERKHRDLGAYNLFVMKAQNVAGSDVKNHRAFMALIGSFWKARPLSLLFFRCFPYVSCGLHSATWSERMRKVQGMERATQDSFNTTYRGLLDALNEKKKAGLKYDFAAELKVFERDHELDTLAFFRVRFPLRHICCLYPALITPSVAPCFC